MDKLLEEENNRQRDIISDMTRQYKSRFEELTEKDKILKKEIDMNSETIQDLDDRYKKIYEEKNTIEKNKLEEIKGLKT